MLSSTCGQVDHAATSESSHPRKLEYWWQYLVQDNTARICKRSEQLFVPLLLRKQWNTWSGARTHCFISSAKTLWASLQPLNCLAHRKRLCGKKFGMSRSTRPLIRSPPPPSPILSFVRRHLRRSSMISCSSVTLGWVSGVSKGKEEERREKGRG